MVEGPILDYLPQIQEIVEKIPSDHFITKTEIEQLDINALKTTFYYTFLKELNDRDYETLEYLVELSGRTLIEIPDGSIVLAPGDSPIKVVHLINLLWKIDEDTYRFRYKPEEYGEYLEDDFDDDFNLIPPPKYKEITKRIKFITFPISGLQHPSPKQLEQLPMYLKGILDSNHVNYQGPVTFINLDNVATKSSQRHTKTALRKLNPEIDLVTIDLEEIWSQIVRRYRLDRHDLYVYQLLTLAENYGARCMPSYKDLSAPLPKLSVVPCNLVITMIYLKAIDRLGQTPSLPVPRFSCYNEPVCLMENKFYYIDFYDLSANDVRSTYGMIKSGLDNVDVYVIEPEVTKFREESFYYGSVVRFEEVPDDNIYGDNLPENREIPLNKVGIITLVNGAKLTAKANSMYGYSTFPWSTEWVEEGNRDGFVRQSLVLDFEPTD